MSSTTLASPIAAAPGSRIRANWIISPREDLTWFIGSALAGYLAVGLMWAGFPLLILQMIWFFGVDGPHVFATVTRTYFDKAERKKLGWFLWILVPLLFVGPVMALAGYASLFFLLAFCWQQFHVVKQHFGFVMLYKAKNRERDATDRKLDRYFLLASLFVPLGLFLLRTHPAVHIPWAAQVAIVAYAILTALWLLRQSPEMACGSRRWRLAQAEMLFWRAWCRSSGWRWDSEPVSDRKASCKRRSLWACSTACNTIACCGSTTRIATVPLTRVNETAWPQYWRQRWAFT